MSSMITAYTTIIPKRALSSYSSTFTRQSQFTKISLSRPSSKSSTSIRYKTMTMWGEGPQTPKKKSSWNDDESTRDYSSRSSTNRGTQGGGQGRGGNTQVDEEGRIIRNRGDGRSSRERDSFYDDDDYGKFDGVSTTTTTSGGSGGSWGWDDNDSFNDGGLEPYEYTRTGSKNRRSGGGKSRERGGRGGRGRGRGGRGGGRGQGRGGRNNDRSSRYGAGPNEKSQADKKINLRALELAGFDHIYGLAPILNALSMNRRDLSDPDTAIQDRMNMMESTNNDEWGDNDDYGFDDNMNDATTSSSKSNDERKPEARYAPGLFMQDSLGSSGGRRFGGRGKVGMKANSALEVEELAKKRGVPIAYVDKGVLNTLCGSRPHQGYVLRCGKLDFEPMSRIPHPQDDPSSPNLWLVLDEVVDPQNFGALLRSAYFLGDGGNNNEYDGSGKIGVMVCAKNSAPASPVVSAASAGALELCEVYSTSNLPRTLNAAKDDGWRILGAAMDVPVGMNDDGSSPVVCEELWNVDPVTKTRPTILVLGSEGHGLRTLVSKACTGFVKIGSGLGQEASGDNQAEESNTNVGVDSLNVSVTGAIMIWHLLSR